VPSRLTEVIVDAIDLERMAEFWCAVLGYAPAGSEDGWVGIGPDVTGVDAAAELQPPGITFVSVLETKAVKNRVHLDVTPVGVSQADEVDRLLALGATYADIGQGEVRWVVLRDPEGNEFCVMPPADVEG
jgi:hypothetical protein